MTVILFGIAALIAGGIFLGLNVDAVADVARCGDQSSAPESCDAASSSDERTKQAAIAIGAFVMASAGLIAAIVGVRARRTGTWK